MSFKCTNCRKEIEKQQGFEYQGNIFCEGCAMDILSPPKACDPWAVHSAETSLRGKDKLSTLTPLQNSIVDYIEKKGEATSEELIQNLNLTEEKLRREFAVLRHMEVLKATKKEEKILYILFQKLFTLPIPCLATITASWTENGKKGALLTILSTFSVTIILGLLTRVFLGVAHYG
jgi:hypothetical protein